MAETVRVLHVINGLGAGGAERSLSELLPLLRDAGVDSAVACLWRRPEGVHDSVAAGGFPVHVVGSQKALAVRRLRGLINGWRPDVVHTTIFESDVLGRVAAAGTPATVLTSLVNTTYDGVRVADAGLNPAKLFAVKTIDAWTARHLTDHYHAITGAVRDSAVQHLGVPAERVSVIERGRDLGRLGDPSPSRRRRIRAALGLPDDAQVVLNVGRQEPQKAHRTLLEAAAKLIPSRPRLTLLQAGRAGKSTPELERAVDELGLADHVHFLGHREDVGDLHAAADVFAFPSVYEGLGGSVLEAMAMRTPIVVSDAPALVEVVERGRGGLVVPVGDSSALATSIAQLLDEPETARALSEQAHEIFLDRFTIERSAERMVQLYRRIAAS
jgi:glycosyltransferase involved in cell wall biosynthesis